MLSVSSVRSSGGAANYFAKDNYYTVSENEEAGVWHGKGASDLGLSGIVEREAFEDILNGKLPDGELVGQKEGRKLGIDLTFSMPKSASIMAYVAGDERILGAHMAAVKKTIDFIERNYAEARISERKGNPDSVLHREAQKTGNLVVALFAHDTSRALDPQGHIHAVIANMTKDLNGTWKALWNGEIWRNNTVMGQAYHAAFRSEVQKLGYETEAAGKHGSFEIKGVPKEIRDEFSKRTEEINAKIKELGIQSDYGKKQATLSTRDDKKNVSDRGALVQEWKDRASALGFDGKALHQEALQRSKQSQGSIKESFTKIINHVRESVGDLFRSPDPMVPSRAAALFMNSDEVKAQHAVASAIRHLSEREAAFEKGDIIRSALGFQIKGVVVEGVEKRITELLREGHLIAGKSERADQHFDYVTTPAALKTEQAILDGIDRGLGKGNVLVPAADVLARLAEVTKERPLNEGQAAAAVMILSSGDQVTTVQGVAGAGKSTMINAVARVAESEGKEVLGLAFQNKMVSDLRGGAAAQLGVEGMKANGIEAQTIASFVNAHHRNAMLGQGPKFEETKAALQNKILLVDESSMVSSKDMLQLIEITHALDLDGLHFIGDRQQLSAIEQGKSFALAQAHGAPMARMDENLRQRGSPLLTAVAGLTNEGFASTAIELLDAHNRVTEGGIDYLQKVADLWLGRDSKSREDTAIFTAGRDDRAEVNKLVQYGLKAEGSLKGEGREVTILQSSNMTREELRYVSSYREGQILEARMGVRELRLPKGEYQVKGIDEKGRVILERDGQSRTIDPARIDPKHKFDRLTLNEQREIKLHEGEKIRWTERDKQLDIAKSTFARVLAISDKGITVELEDKRSMTLLNDDPMLKRLDLGYALNAHMAQGITQKEAIQAISAYQRNLATQRSENVLATRATHDLHVVTDNVSNLKAQLDRNPGNKTSALETIGKLSVDSQPKAPVGIPMHGGMSDELKAKIEAVPKAPDRTNTLPVPERKLGLDLA